MITSAPSVVSLRTGTAVTQTSPYVASSILRVPPSASSDPTAARYCGSSRKLSPYRLGVRLRGRSPS